MAGAGDPIHGGMSGIGSTETAENYRRFAHLEAAGRSPSYETLALSVADDPAILAFLDALPPLKRQPNLLFAAARRRPPIIHRGDLLDDLLEVATGAPLEATLVVYHSATLAYVDEDKRRAFAGAVSELGAVWLSNEGDGVLRCIGVNGDDPASFILVRDGREILARTDPHATWVEWLEARS